jgi:hypothetical protein
VGDWPLLEQGAANEPPFTLWVPLFVVPDTAGRPDLRVEIVAPDGLDIETASLDDADGTVLDQIDTGVGGGAFVQLVDPDKAAAPATLRAVFGFPNGGIHQVALIAGATSTLTLLAACAASFWLGTKLSSNAASALTAAPGLVTSFALGFATTRLTSRPVNRLRLAAFVIALIGVAGAFAIALLADPKTKPDYSGALPAVLLIAFVLSAAVTLWWPLAAATRPRATSPRVGQKSTGSVRPRP